MKVGRRKYYVYSYSLRQRLKVLSVGLLRYSDTQWSITYRYYLLYLIIRVVQTLGHLPDRPIMVDLTIEEGQRLKVLYGSSRGFHAVDLDTMDVFDIYIPQHVGFLWLITSVLVFVCLSVCLSVCGQDYAKTSNVISWNLVGLWTAIVERTDCFMGSFWFRWPNSSLICWESIIFDPHSTDDTCIITCHPYVPCRGVWSTDFL